MQCLTGHQRRIRTHSPSRHMSNLHNPVYWRCFRLSSPSFWLRHATKSDFSGRLRTASFRRSVSMRALVYADKNKVAVEDRPKPAISVPTDAIVKVKHTTICGTDLHILKGDVPTAQPGRVLGNEGVGVVEEIGASVNGFVTGDTVLISCITACAACPFCRRGMHSHCESGGWILGNKVDGTQAEYVRVPHATASLYKLPSTVDLKNAVICPMHCPLGWNAAFSTAKCSLEARW